MSQPDRFAIAAQLLKLPDARAAREAIKTMNRQDREHLAGLVDWVQDYENEEAKKP